MRDRAVVYEGLARNRTLTELIRTRAALFFCVRAVEDPGRDADARSATFLFHNCRSARAKTAYIPDRCEACCSLDCVRSSIYACYLLPGEAGSR